MLERGREKWGSCFQVDLVFLTNIFFYSLRSSLAKEDEIAIQYEAALFLEICMNFFQRLN